MNIETANGRCVYVEKEGKTPRHLDPDHLRDALSELHTKCEDGAVETIDWDEWRATHALADSIERDGWTDKVSTFYKHCSPTIKATILQATLYTDPYAEIVRDGADEEGFAKIGDVAAHYREEVERFPQAALAFALSAMDSEFNRPLGLEVMGMLVERRGWKYVFDAVCNGDVHTYAFTKTSAPIANLAECARVMGDPVSLPIPLLEQYMDATHTAFDRLHIEALVNERRQIEALEGFSDDAMRLVLSEQSAVRWWDDEKVCALVSGILDNDPVEYACYVSQCLASGDVPQKILDDVQVDSHVAWGYLVARYNNAKVQGDPSTVGLWQGRIEEVLLPSEELRARTQQSVQHDTRAFQFANWSWRSREYKKYEAPLYMDEYEIDKMFISYASRQSNPQNDPYIYAQSSYVAPIARGTFALFDPEGHFLDLAVPEKDARHTPRREGLPSVERIVGMLAALRDSSHEEEECAVACALIFWEELSPELRLMLSEHYRALGAPLEMHVEDMKMLDFDNVVKYSARYAGAVPVDLHQRLQVYAESLYAEAGTCQQALRTVRLESFVSDANAEYGGNGIRESKVRELFAHMQFDVVRFLTETVGVPLNELSRREYFNLLVLLDMRKDGLRELEQIIASATTEDGRKNRIHALLMLEGGGDAAEVILALTAKYPSGVLDALFANYGALTRSRDELEAYLCETYGCTDDASVRDTIAKISSRGMERGAKLLHAHAEHEVSDINVSSATHEVTSVNTDLALLNDSYREMKRLYPDLTLEQLASVRIETLDNKAVRSRPELVEQMEQIYRENWSEKSEEFVAEKIEKFRARLAGDGRMYVATYEQGGVAHVLAFASVGEGTGGKVFVSALNRNPSLEVGDMGRVMLERIIAHESGSGVLTGDTEHGSRHERTYVNTYGFVGTSLLSEKGDVLLMNITLDKTLNSRLVSKECTTLAGAQALETQARVIDQQQPIVQLASLKNTDELSALFAKGYVLTRIFSEGVAVCERAV